MGYDGTVWVNSMSKSGGESKSEKRGYGRLSDHNNISIALDGFTGSGEDYRPREVPLVIIHNPKTALTYKFTPDELFTLLEGHEEK